MAYLPASSPHVARSMRAGRAMGDVEPVRGPHADLLEQVNRFTSRGEYGTQVFDLASVTLPTVAITTAAIIYQNRLLVSEASIPDAGTHQLIADLASAMQQGKTAWFVTANEARIAATLKGYADAKGLPGWPPGVDTFLTRSTIVPIVAAAALAAWILWRKA